MARKRKIPARKHHGIRDPLKQLEDKEKKFKNVVNNPPERGDDQKISNKFAQFKKLADRAKAGKKFKKLQCGREDFPKSSKQTQTSKVKPVKQLSGETDEDYLKRINRITTQSLKEAQYEAKYGVNIVRDKKTGEIKIEKKPRNEIDELLKQKQNDRFKRGKVSKKKIDIKNAIDPKQAKELIKQAIKESVEEEKQDSQKLEEYKHDVIKFGEIVHAPPTLSTLPRKAQKSDTVPRPGKKDNLLLKSIMNNTNISPSGTEPLENYKKSKPQAVTPEKIQLKGKRKALPAATRSMLETEQNKIVELYRKLKKSKEKKFIN